MIKYCIFDLDGTLLDTIETIRYYVNKTLSRHSIAPISHEECRNFVGAGARSLMTRTLASRGITDAKATEALLSEYIPDYDKDPYYLTKPYEGISKMIKELRAAGITLAVLSNKPDFATRSMIRHFFGNDFSVVRGGRENLPLKPAPEAVLSVLSELGARADETAYIGDSEVDVFTAKNFSPSLALFCLWGFRTREELLAAGANELISHPSEISKRIINK